MILYVDSSVLLRVVLHERGRLREWARSRRWISSQLVRTECLRTIDRARLRFGLTDDQVAIRRGAILEYLRAFDLIALDSGVLERAADPFPTSIGTLDAVHLASAMLARAIEPALAFATHDRELGLAARAAGFRVFGVAGLG
ncbi:MAG: type II toxin-antitoxin system VapC family toxin [Deltaproteobacteria bacterium]|nr:type II toxin-antitoxin system VapC family toxin [Deltaproteobacteria bacterium]